MTYQDLKSIAMLSLALAMVTFFLASCARNKEADYWIAVGKVTKETMEKGR